MIRKKLSLQVDSCLAAISMYTRLPAWRLKTLGAESYARAINALPLVGLITGGLMASVFCLSYHVLHCDISISVILALIARLLLTGAFHEDGLGDFFDGFGGGVDRESILRIMKDSHVGSYAVIGYIMYYALLLALLSNLVAWAIPVTLLLCDIIGRLSVLALVYALPYARTSAESKIQLVYTPKRLHIAPPLLLLLAIYIGQYLLGWGVCLLFFCNAVLATLYILYVRYKLGGYTGDTCGAMILLLELASIFYIYIDLKV